MPVPDVAPQNQKAYIPPARPSPSNIMKTSNKPAVSVPVPKDPVPGKLLYDPPASSSSISAEKDDQGEFFEVPNPNAGTDWFIQQQPLKSAAEVQAEWTDIIQSLKNDASEIGPINEEDQIVPGFADGIRLKPWQVQGKFWMKDREEDKKRGGILADDVSP
jgi:hypothetical protein